MNKARQLIVGALAVAAVALATPAAGVAAAPDLATCTNIVNGSATYNGPDNDPANIVSGGIFTETASCRSVVYTMNVITYDASGTQTGLLSTSVRGAGNTFVGPFSVSNVTADFVCIYFTSSRGPTVYETAYFEGVPCPESFDPTQQPLPAGVTTPGNSPGGGGYF